MYQIFSGSSFSNVSFCCLSVFVIVNGRSAGILNPNNPKDNIYDSENLSGYDSSYKIDKSKVKITRSWHLNKQ